MCSSLLGLGGTYVQQCFVCFFPQYLCAAFSCIFKTNSICLLLSYMSYQHHAGLQPANLVTYSLRSCSRRSKLFVRLFFTLFLQFIQYFVFFRPFTTELQYGVPTSDTYRTRYFRTLGPRYLGPGIWASWVRYLGPGAPVVWAQGPR